MADYEQKVNKTGGTIKINYTLCMAYRIKLTDAEMDTLGWAVNHGYFPELTYGEMEMTEESREIAERMEDYGTRGQNHKVYEFEYEIPEFAAWAISDQRHDDPHSLFACIGSPLIEKLSALENSIV